MPRRGTIRNDLERARVNLNARRRKSKLTLFRLAHRMHVRNGMEVFVVIHHHDEDRYRLYTSQPNAEWPPPLQKIEKMYPIPEIWSPENIVPLYMATPSVPLPQSIITPTPRGPGTVAGINATAAAHPVNPLGLDLPCRDLGHGAVEHDDNSNNDDDDGWGDNCGQTDTSGTAPSDDGFSFMNLCDEPMASTEALSALPAAALPTSTKETPSRREAASSRLRSIVVEIPQRNAQLGSPIRFRDDMPVQDTPAMSPRTPSPPPGLDKEYPYDSRGLAVRIEDLALRTPSKPKAAPHSTNKTPQKVKMPRKVMTTPRKVPTSTAPRKSAAGAGGIPHRRPEIRSQLLEASGVKKTWSTQHRGTGGKFAPGRT